MDLKILGKSDAMKYKLSLCIPTLNRASYIGETLESIVSQWEDGVEIVIVDGGSTDDTERVVNSYQHLYSDIRYIKKNSLEKKPSNEGFDRDCDHAVELAEGEYCWLMTDDDLLMPGAIIKVLREIGNNFAVIVTSVEIRNKDLTKVLVSRRPKLLQDKIYKPDEWNQFAAKIGSHLTFVGAVIVDRRFWLSRNREKYFGTGFVHVGVIFDETIVRNVIVISDPLVSIRFGNAQWSSRAFQIWMFGWPELIWSFPTLSFEAKQAISQKEPWNDLKTLIIQRTLGTYSIREYHLVLNDRYRSKGRSVLAMIIARLPRSLLLLLAYIYAWTRSSNSDMLLFNLNGSWNFRK